MATWHVELTRKGPGLLLHDMNRGAPDIDAVVAGIATTAPDILLLTGIDWDHGGLALAALSARLSASGHPMAHAHAPPQNAGVDSGADLDGDGRAGTPDDAQGWGRFTGQAAMAVLSRWPIDAGAALDLSRVLWRDLPGALLADDTGAPILTDAALAVQRLSSVAHWALPVDTPQGRVTLLTIAATPPVFDGPEDRNGRRNHDEAALWLAWLDGALPDPPTDTPVILLGKLNADPFDGDARRGALRRLLSHPRLQDAAPASDTGRALAATQGGVNATQRGDPAQDTADWADDGPGNLRSSYILPDRALTVTGAGLYWAPSGGDGPLPRNALVWVDLVRDGLR